MRIFPLGKATWLACRGIHGPRAGAGGQEGRLGLFIHPDPIMVERELAAPGEPWLHSLTDFAAAEGLFVAIG